jgi:hypothetical protein
VRVGTLKKEEKKCRKKENMGKRGRRKKRREKWRMGRGGRI